jgi:HTH-type transcriptional regulator/antitoxin HipB
MFPIGNIAAGSCCGRRDVPDREHLSVARRVVTSSTDLGSVVRERRTSRGLRQEDLALASGTGRRFVVELEQGKPNVRLDSTLAVLQALGLELTVAPRDGAL